MADERVFDILNEFQRKLNRTKYVDNRSDGKITYKPFYSSISVKGDGRFHLDVENGGTTIITNELNTLYGGRVEIRIGSRKDGEVASGVFSLPRDLEKQVSLSLIRNKANEVFWECAEYLEKRRAETLGFNENLEKKLFFSKVNPVKYIESNEKKISNIDLSEIEENLKKISAKLIENQKIYEVDSSFRLFLEERYFINSEGSKIFTNFLRYTINITPSAVDEKNLIVPHLFSHSGTDLSKFPSLEELMERGEKTTEELMEIIKSPLEKNGAYPAILSSENHGVLWHEAIGHALEGHRMQEDNFENLTTMFKGRIDEKIAPEFISVYDDPTIKELDGHYLYDEEGVLAQKVTLVENGILKNYLHSRSSAGFFKTNSNGHARAEGTKDPNPRMSNLIIKSSNETSMEELKENLIKLCEKQNKPYGLMLGGMEGVEKNDSEGGETYTEESVYKIYPANIFRIYRNGKTKRVRGVYTVGTPSLILENILQTGNNYGIFNGSCGAESGDIPSTQTAPEALISSLEINVKPKSEYRKAKNFVVPK